MQDIGEQGDITQTHHGRRQNTADTGSEVLRIALSMKESEKKRLRKRVRHKAPGDGEEAKRHVPFLG